MNEGKDPEVPFQVIAQYSYVSEYNVDLHFEKDQIISVISIEDNQWYYGHFVDSEGLQNEGIFPKTFVTILKECLKFGANGSTGGFPSLDPAAQMPFMRSSAVCKTPKVSVGIERGSAATLGSPRGKRSPVEEPRQSTEPVQKQRGPVFPLPSELMSKALSCKPTPVKIPKGCSASPINLGYIKNDSGSPTNHGSPPLSLQEQLSQLEGQQKLQHDAQINLLKKKKAEKENSERSERKNYEWGYESSKTDISDSDYFTTDDNDFSGAQHAADILPRSSTDIKEKTPTDSGDYSNANISMSIPVDFPSLTGFESRNNRRSDESRRAALKKRIAKLSNTEKFGVSPTMNRFGIPSVGLSEPRVIKDKFKANSYTKDVPSPTPSVESKIEHAEKQSIASLEDSQGSLDNDEFYVLDHYPNSGIDDLDKKSFESADELTGLNLNPMSTHTMTDLGDCHDGGYLVNDVYVDSGFKSSDTMTPGIEANDELFSSEYKPKSAPMTSDESPSDEYSIPVKLIPIAASLGNSRKTSNKSSSLVRTGYADLDFDLSMSYQVPNVQNNKTPMTLASNMTLIPSASMIPIDTPMIRGSAAYQRYPINNLGNDPIPSRLASSIAESNASTAKMKKDDSASIEQVLLKKGAPPPPPSATTTSNRDVSEHLGARMGKNKIGSIHSKPKKLNYSKSLRDITGKSIIHSLTPADPQRTLEPPRTFDAPKPFVSSKGLDLGSSKMAPPPPPQLDSADPSNASSPVFSPTISPELPEPTSAASCMPEFVFNRKDRWWLDKKAPTSLGVLMGSFIWECDEKIIDKRGNAKSICRDFYFLFDNYSQLHVWVLFDERDPVGTVKYWKELKHFEPERFRFAPLTDFSSKIHEKALDLVGKFSKGFVRKIYAEFPNLIAPIGNTYGVTVFEYTAGDKIDGETLKAVKVGDILIITCGQFVTHSRLLHRNIIEFTPNKPHVSIISSYDCNRKKIRVIESEGDKVKQGSYRLAEFADGQLKICRAIPREVLGW
ncbi:HGL173Wp [Eremothecium sinecaudum]|uniref:HGL173Wp n=1 Tax=Eremothecium sinecaudum TaxID=45286 RepID=A0A0X8HVD2_9SACH|nr:HGL173Wp [Eremothecium sinecaudum]AMD22167.1 HGL173Wp [Eremothecium sinecaudum]